jgi:hypothetical protein
LTSTATQNIGNGFTRTATVAASGIAGTTLTIGGGQITGTASGVQTGRSITLEYTRAAAFSLHDFNINSVLAMRLFNSSLVDASNWLVTVTAGSNAFNGSDPGGPRSVSFTPVAGVTSSVNGGSFGNGLVLSNVNKLTIGITYSGIADVAFSSGANGGIRAVPEPATMSLLGLTAIGGIFAHRRRKNQLAA